jgi:hypothetical protein
VIRRTPELADFERHHARERERRARERGRDATYGEALEVFAALWAEAVALNPGFPGDWREDVEPDLEIARALNDLPPGA